MAEARNKMVSEIRPGDLLLYTQYEPPLLVEVIEYDPTQEMISYQAMYDGQYLRGFGHICHFFREEDETKVVHIVDRHNDNKPTGIFYFIS